MDAGAPDPCLSATDCRACGGRSGCGWCADNDRCVGGTASGPRAGSCARWAFVSSACPAPPPPPPPARCPSGTYPIWTCASDRWSRVRCVSGRVEVERCPLGCDVRPVGVDDVCVRLCPCSPGGNNYCHHAPRTPGCWMTQPGGYCDPNGDGSYADADWVRGYYEHQACAR